jgi:hypothetical protein
MVYSTRVILQMTEVIGEYVVIEKDLREFLGQPELCCGPTAAEDQLQGSSQAFAQQLQSSYSTLFGQQQSTLANLNAKLGQIASGTQGPGFGGSENASNISSIENAGAAAGRNADQSVVDAEAGQGGGAGSALRNGVQAELKAQTATSAANQESNALLQNTEQNYQVGRENAAATAGGLAQLAGEESPNSAAGSAISENSQSFGQANQIQEQQNALAKDIAGGITSLGGAFLSGGMSMLGGGGGPSVGQVEQESQGNYADNYIQPPIAPTVAPPMAFPG